MFAAFEESILEGRSLHSAQLQHPWISILSSRVGHPEAGAMVRGGIIDKLNEGTMICLRHSWSTYAPPVIEIMLNLKILEEGSCG
jgi:hypothetical protein